MQHKPHAPVIIIDIETVSGSATLAHLSVPLQEHWRHKASQLRLSEEEQDSPEAGYRQRAGIYAEFGKIVCIGLGVIDKKQKHIRIKSLYNEDEYTLLQTFIDTLETMEHQQTPIVFAGHNIKEFDLPYICRRCLILGISLPPYLSLSGLKPWEIAHIDTMELWKFGDYKHYTSLDLLANVLQIPSSKEEISGADVSHVYWIDNDLPKIARYCMRDIYTTGLVYMRLSGQETAGYEAQYV